MTARYSMRVVASSIDEALETAEREFRKLLGDEPTFMIVIDEVEPDEMLVTQGVLAWRLRGSLTSSAAPIAPCDQSTRCRPCRSTAIPARSSAGTPSP